MDSLLQEVGRVQSERRFGRVSGVQGLLVEIVGMMDFLSIGTRLTIQTRSNSDIKCEIVGFKDGKALAMPYDNLDGVGIGCKAYFLENEPVVYPSDAWLGRVVNALGEPIDGKGPIQQGPQAQIIKANPPAAHTRQRVGGKVDMGVRTLNAFINCCEGQRMGIFAGSGVGKSVMLSMLARYTAADVTVIGLVGERGREVQEFLQDDLGEEGLARSVVVVATSDESALMRRQAAYLTLTLSEYFRDQNNHVLCLMDSVTRFAMAQREIGLAGGEPPASKGYTPTVFTELPRLLERAGPGAIGTGNISGIFTVLVEGDDHNEPVADAVRGILDGHIVMERSIAERGRFPAINVLKSISRTMPECNDAYQNFLVSQAKRFMAAYSDMEEMIRLGAYRVGSNEEVDASIHYYPMLEAFMNQRKEECTRLEDCYYTLQQILENGPAQQVIQEGLAKILGADQDPIHE